MTVDDWVEFEEAVTRVSIPVVWIRVDLGDEVVYLN